MAQQTIDIGSAPNDGTGDPIRDAFDKTNDNFTELYSLIAASGASWKAVVRVATTGAGTLATSFENGDTVDGVTLATGDRILIKNQAAPAENGIYVVAASGAPARASDADAGAEMVNAAVMVSEGTANADKLFVCTANAPVTLNTTALPWSELGGSAAPTFSGAKVRKASNLTAQNITSMTDITWTAEDYDSASYHDNSTNPERLTAPVTGYYHVDCTLVIGNVTAGNDILVQLRHANGGGHVEYVALTSLSLTVTGVHYLNLGGDVHLTAGDYVVVAARLESDTSVDINTDSNMSIHLIAAG